MARAVVAGAAALALGCDGVLPDPDSTGARLYAERCSGCHRLYQPRTMTPHMWRIQVERKQREFARRGARPLSDLEVRVLLAYLGTYAYGSSADGRKAPETTD
jgi:hypothetical protein